MDDVSTSSGRGPISQGGFHSTRWSQVLASRDRDAEAGTVALETLCRQYWQPVYGFIRRRGNNRDQAQDLTQAFFAEVLERGSLAKADPERGRFRAFIKTLIDRFLANEHQRNQALKRGGGFRQLSLDWQSGEHRYSIEPADGQTAESVFERQWALTVLESAEHQLSKEYEAKGREGLFEHLREFIIPGGEPPRYAELAETTGQSATALKVSVHRMRDRFRSLIRQSIADTLQSNEDVDDELRHLLSVLRGS